MNEYEDILYDDFPYEEAHISRLATLAHLFGLPSIPVNQCRVLELGCGLGGHLIPMAEQFGDSQFIGIDSSAPQIERGAETIRALDLRNIELSAMNILEFPGDAGPFDYIVCHGVYSWVPPEVQQKILSIMREQLSPRGVAYISYNTYPGWHLRGMLREVLVRETGGAKSKAEKIQRGRELLSLLSLAPPHENSGGSWLKHELSILGHMSDGYLLYEHLARHNRPVYFRDFAADAMRIGLQYLGDAHFYTMIPERFGSQAAQAIQSMSHSILDTEHYMDLLDIRYFRRTLLCHREHAVDRSISWKRLLGLGIATPLKPASPAPDVQSDCIESFEASEHLELSTPLPLLKAALLLLSQSYPAFIQFDDLCTRARAMVNGGETQADARPDESDLERLGSNLLGLFARNQIQLSICPPRCERGSGPHAMQPKTSALARLQARRQSPGCTNLRHRNIAVDSFERSLLSRMDGAHSMESLVDGVCLDIGAGKVSVELNGAPCSDPAVIAEVAGQKLTQLAQKAFLVAE